MARVGEADNLAWTVHIGDCLGVLASMDAESVDAVVTDPPYGLAFMGKSWDHAVPGPEFFAAMLRVAKPGAHLVAFGGTRLYHRMTCAMEDAGWEVRDCLMWLYGTGFPKSHNGVWGGTALKPAWEPIVLARKPLAGTVEANHAAHGLGGLDIDGCRAGDSGARNNGRKIDSDIYGKFGPTARVDYEKGRWPANLILDSESAGVLDAQAGERGGGFGVRGGGGVEGRTSYAMGGNGEVVGYGDSGGASRFFYCPKADHADREDGLDGFARSVSQSVALGDREYGTLPSGEIREMNPRARANHHPTVKPTDLMRWLVRLVTPEGGLVLDPFAGSGSTGRGCVLEGRRFVGIEREADYAAIAEARIRAAEESIGLFAAGVA